VLTHDDFPPGDDSKPWVEMFVHLIGRWGALRFALRDGEWTLDRDVVSPEPRRLTDKSHWLPPELQRLCSAANANGFHVRDEKTAKTARKKTSKRVDRVMEALDALTPEEMAKLLRSLEEK
jgi:hypothetical protein